MIMFVHPEIDTQILLNENCVNILSVENPTKFYQYIKMLFEQFDGSVGDFVFSHGLDILKPVDIGEIIVSPFYIEYNSKKMQNALYKDLSKSFFNGALLPDINDINCKAQLLLQNLSHTSSLSLVFSEEIEIIDLLKLYNMKIEDEYLSLLAKLVNYVNILIELKKISVLVLVDIKKYLSEIDCLEFYKHCSYSKICLLLIENGIKLPLLEQEKAVIIDNDLCEIVANYK